MLDIVFLSAGAIFALVWGMAIIFEKQTKQGHQLYLAALLFLNSVWLFSGAIKFGKLESIFPNLEIYTVPLIAFIGPFLYALSYSALNIKPRLNILKFLKLCLPVFLFLSLFTGLAIQRNIFLDSATNSENDLLSSFFKQSDFFGLSNKFLIIFYTIAFMLRHRIVYSIHSALPKSFRYGFLLLFIFIVVSLGLGAAGRILDDIRLVRLSAHLLPILQYGFFIFYHRYPDLFYQIGKSAKKVRYERSRLKGVDESLYIQKLDALMTEESLYADEDITLGKLADLLELNAHQLSELLNNHLNKNFNQYVNSHRIMQAQHLLVAETNRTSLSIALAVGFNSKSAFHRAFSKATGITPQEYRRNYAQK